MNDKACSFDRSLLVSYFYEECSIEERLRVEAHLAGCQACGEELAGFRRVRTRLGEWAPPEEILGFQVVRQAEPTRRWWWPLPVWAQAAAAVLVLMAGAAAANLEVRVGSDGLVVRTGWSQPAPGTTARVEVPPGVPAAPADQVAGAPAFWRTELAAFEQQLRREFVPRADNAQKPVPGAATPLDERRILAQVRDMVRDSEDRQRSEFGVRLAGALSEFDTKRRSDLVRIQESFGQLEGRTGIEAARTNNMLQYLMRVSQTGGTVIK